MTNLSTKYLTIGLRRDENFNDIPSKRTALNNLLNQLVNDPTKTFISEDLEVIRGIQNTAVSISKLNLLDDSSIQYSETRPNTVYSHPISIIATYILGSNPARTLVTVVTRSAHNLLSGTRMSIVGTTNVLADGIFTITVIDSLTFTYTADGNFSGELIRRIISATGDGVRPNSTVTVTYNISHNLTQNSSVDLAGTTSNFTNGTFTVITVPAPETLTFIAGGFISGSVFPSTSIVSTTATRITGTEVQTVLVEPRVTLKDRVEVARVVTGLIPPIRGGNGLRAKFVPSGKINIGTSASTGTTIFDDLENAVEDIFWDSGYFSFPDVIEQSFNDQYGGLQWEGYFAPSVEDNEVLIGVSSTGLVMIEWDRLDNDNWTTLLNLYAAVREVPVDSIVEDVATNSYTVTLPDTSLPLISVNDFVVSIGTITVTGINLTNSTITFSAPVTSNAKNQIEIYDHILKTIRIFPVITGTGTTSIRVAADVDDVNVDDLLADTFDQLFLVSTIDYDTNEVVAGPIVPGVLTPGVSTSFFVCKILGESITTNTVYLRATDLSEKLKIRISHWYPDTGQNIFDKSIDFSYINSSLLPYPYLYDELPPEEPEPTEIRAFVRNLVSPFQREIGASGGSANNKSLYVNNSFLTAYVPVGSYPEVRLAGPVTITFTTESDFITGSLTAAELGSVIVPRVDKSATNIDTLVQIKANRGSSQKVTTVNIGADGTESVNVISPRGFITWCYATVNGATATIINSGTDLTNIRKGLIVIPFREIVISAITVGATTTITTGTTAHGFLQGQQISITSATGVTAINGTWIIATVPTGTSFTIAVATSGTYTANSARVYTKFNYITSITETDGVPSSFTTNFPLQPTGAGVETVLYLYADRGLIDASKDIYCDGVFGQVVAVGITQTTIDATPGGITQLTFKDVSGISNGQIVQLADTFQEGTLVQAVNVGTRVVTISKPIVKAIKESATVIFTPGSLLISKTLSSTAAVGATTINVSNKTDLKVGQDITFQTSFVFGTIITEISPTSNSITISSPVVTQITSGTTVRFLLNREGCVMPKDTSPPFIGTVSGLRTGPNIGLKSADDVVTFKLSVNNFAVTNIPTPGTISLSVPQTVNKLVRIKNKPAGSSTEVVYYALASTNGS